MCVNMAYRNGISDISLAMCHDVVKVHDVFTVLGLLDVMCA